MNKNIEDVSNNECDPQEWKFHSWQGRIEASGTWMPNYISFFHRDYTSETAAICQIKEACTRGFMLNLDPSTFMSAGTSYRRHFFMAELALCHADNVLHMRVVE